MSAKASTPSSPTRGPGQARVRTTAEDKPAVETEGSIAYPPDAAPVPLAARAFVFTCIAFSPQLAFCWRFILVSFYGTYHYYLYFFGFLGRPTCSSRAKFLFEGLLHVAALALLTSLCISITPVHVVAPTLMDLWTPYAVHPALRATKVVYDAGPPAELDIFAIHGLGSNPESAWAYRSNESRVHWLRDLLPEEQEFRNSRVIMLNHQTRWDSNTAYLGLHEHASELLENIQSLHKDHPERPIIFIAHSFGGLLLKKALLLAKSRSKHVAEMTKGIVFLGVPHRGTHAAILASCLSCMSFFRGSSSHMLELMAVDGPALLDLESEFYDSYVVQYRFNEIQPYICDVYELRPERVGKLVLGSIVRPKYGHLRHGRLVALDTDHRGLNKFQSSDDPNWQIFLRILRQARDHALEKFHVPEGKHSLPAVPTHEPPLVPEPSPMPGSNASGGAGAAPDIVALMVQDAPYLRTSPVTSACLWALQELAATWLTRARDRSDSHYARRAVESAIYGAIVRGPVAGLHLWLLGLAFSGRSGSVASALKGVHLMFIALPSQVFLDQCMLAIIAGARLYGQVSATIRLVFWRSLISQWLLILACLIFAWSGLVTPAWWPALFATAKFAAEANTTAYVKKRRLAALRRMFRAPSKSKADTSRFLGVQTSGARNDIHSKSESGNSGGLAGRQSPNMDMEGISGEHPLGTLAITGSASSTLSAANPRSQGPLHCQPTRQIRHRQDRQSPISPDRILMSIANEYKHKRPTHPEDRDPEGGHILAADREFGAGRPDADHTTASS